MDAVLWILFVAALGYAWVKAIAFALRADRKKTISSQFDDMMKNFFANQGDREKP